jgi:tripartite-type tricarboxylate transporter receptor subunit TctC
MLGSAGALAQSYPTKPVTIIVPFAAGGTTDILARIIGQALTTELGQSVIVDNRAGAGGNIGGQAAAKATPDGYTLFMGTVGTHAINASLYKKMPFDPIKDFAPLTRVANVPNLLVANPNQPFKSVKDLIAYAKANPGKVNFGSSGNGSSIHLSGELFKSMAKVDMQHVPYKGSAPAMTDLIGGQIPFTVDTVSAALPHLKDGKVKAIAVTTAKRSSLLPKVPTLAENGYPGLEMDTWLAVVAPKGLPPAVKTRLELTLAQVVSDPETRDKLIGMGFEPAYGSSKALAELIDKELPLMRAIAQRASITAD